MIGTFVKALQQSLKMCWIFQTDTEWVYSHLTGRLKNCQLNQQWICCCAICFIIRAMWANVGQHLAIFYICGTWYHIFVQQSVFFFQLNWSHYSIINRNSMNISTRLLSLLSCPDLFTFSPPYQSLLSSSNAPFGLHQCRIRSQHRQRRALDERL